MGIKQDNDGTWSASYSKRHPLWKVPISLNRKKLASKAEATRVYGELVVAVNQKIAEKVAPTWRRVVEKHLEQRKLNGYTEKTLYSETVCIRKYSSHWDTRYIDSIKTIEIYEVINHMSSDSNGHKTFILKCLRGVFTYAVECGFINRNPTPNIKFRSPEKIMPFLTEPQMIKFLTHARDLNNEWYPIWACAVFLGMRNGELYALKKNRVNIEDRTILVNESWNNKDGFKSTKTGDDRLIEIPKPLLPIIKNMLIALPESEFLLPRIHGWSRGEQAKRLSQFLIGIGLPKVRFHDLRATWATMLLAKSVAPAVVMKMGGWKDMETMMIYMRKAGLDIKGATDCLDKIFNPEATLDNVISLHKC